MSFVQLLCHFVGGEEAGGGGGDGCNGSTQENDGACGGGGGGGGQSGGGAGGGVVKVVVVVRKYIREHTALLPTVLVWLSLLPVCVYGFCLQLGCGLGMPLDWACYCFDFCSRENNKKMCGLGSGFVAVLV
jgi:hypothetical protein